MSQITRITFTVDQSKLFDQLRAMDRDTAPLGNRIVNALLDGKPGGGFLNRVGMAAYGVEIADDVPGDTPYIRTLQSMRTEIEALVTETTAEVVRLMGGGESKSQRAGISTAVTNALTKAMRLQAEPQETTTNG